ncbi:nuclear GTPase SLIP-GC-like isoform X9 [Dicentrarchus labrax]|uniref:nuclear GTPase SLIP-GC-like isoform X9 n=1 Tax=Dicentrarchus labrax TaxID=13489 RepID=UPI0021F588E5|nr:nuclear GTPase SLIP-GC-like isoform X9 [Dicentrarchus labrax]
MDVFVHNKLTEWGLSEWIERFKAERITKKSLYCLDNEDIANLIPAMGPRAIFKEQLKLLKKAQNPTTQRTVDSSAQCKQEHKGPGDSPKVWPSTSGTSDKGKIKLQPSGRQSPTIKRRRDTTPGSFTGERIKKESLYCVRNQGITNLIPKKDPTAIFKKQLQLIPKAQNPTTQRTVDSSAQCKQEHKGPGDSPKVWLSTSGTSDKGKIKLQPSGRQSPTIKRRRDTTPGSFTGERIKKESLYCVRNQGITNLIPKKDPTAIFKKQLQLIPKAQNPTTQGTVDSSAQCKQEHKGPGDSPKVWPSTSGTSDKGKRKLEPSGRQSPTSKRRRDTTPGSFTEEIILSDVKEIMKRVRERIPNQGNQKLNKFLKDKIGELETDKREMVGVFGKTGAGKSSLINAVIGEKNLLPSGRVSACTSVMIKVEANLNSPMYKADIEFITKEEWKDELWSLHSFLEENAAQENEDDDDYRDFVEKLSALYGEEWKNKSPENLMDYKYFKEIPEFYISSKKRLKCKSAKELSEQFVRYIRSDSTDGEGKDVKSWYWPLVKCVTIRVPNNDLLKHVTLVDLPGNGDRNKSRDKMWKEVVGNCSTVWIVTDINRAAAEKEPWEILKSACSLMGNGGQCQQIHFICTKSDVIEDSDDLSAADVRALILKENSKAKDKVREEFSKLNKIKKHFSDDCLEVFTVSSKEFLKQKHLNSDDTEIPKLQEFLKDLNDCHSETLIYVSGAYGILSLIQGARRTEVVAQKTEVCTILEDKMRQELEKVRKPMEEAYKVFEKCLSEGVERSKPSCQQALSSIYPSEVSGRGFHRILKCVVQNNGTYTPKKGDIKKQINLNVDLASRLTDSIDEEFKKTFPNERKYGAFNGVINNFSLDTERLIQKHGNVELQLIFLKTEEEKMKTKLNKITRERKKTIYSSLTTTIEEAMKECYQIVFYFVVEAADFKGKDSLKNMRDTIEKHVHDSKNIMFQQAKNEMLNQLRDLKEHVLDTLEKTMQKSIELSLKTDGDTIPDVTVELAEVKKCYDELKGSPDEEMSLIWPEADSSGPAAALRP